MNPLVPAKILLEFIAYAEANPGKIRIGSPGIGTPAHVAGELFKMVTGVDMLHVPYRGTVPALTDLLGGQVDVYFGASSGSIEHVKVGKLRALATTGAARSEVLPELPTVAELVPGFEASTWFGLGAPKGTAIEIVDRLNKEVIAALSDPKTRARFAELGSEPLVGTPTDFGKLIADETEKWARVIKLAGLALTSTLSSAHQFVQWQAEQSGHNFLLSKLLSVTLGPRIGRKRLLTLARYFIIRIASDAKCGREAFLFRTCGLTINDNRNNVVIPA